MREDLDRPVTDENKWQSIRWKMTDIKQNDRYRTVKEISSAQSAHVIYKGKEVVMLASNSYLDLSNEAKVKEKASEMLNLWGVGSGGSRLTTGNVTLHQMLEKKLAEFKGTEAALLYNTGYMANVGIIQAMCGKEDIIFSDELNHASIIDGCRLSGAKIVIYKHNDMEDLERKILDYPGCHGLIVSDAVFSMDGDILELPEFLRLAKKYQLFSMVDEAHATGVIGDSGRGIVEYYHSPEKPDILMGTLSKAIGAEGGFVCGSHLLIDYLINTSRSFIFSTSLAPSTVAAALKALEILDEEPWRVKKLQENVRYFSQCLRDEGIETHAETAIIPVIIGSEKKALDVSKELLNMGFFISAIRYPTVPKDSARLRIALMAAHTKDDLREAAQAIGGLIRR